MNTNLKFIEEHPALITICLFLLGGVGFLIKRIFFSKKKPNAPYIKAGRDISARGDIIVGNKTINQSQTKKDKNIERFKNLIGNASWRKELIEHKETWICDEDNTYQIDISAEWRDFTEDWTDVYPNKKAFFQPVLLKIGGVTIKEIHFVYCDETKIVVPLPKRVVHDDLKTYHYEWNRNSIEFKLAKIIGHYHIYENIEGVARMSKISII